MHQSSDIIISIYVPGSFCQRCWIVSDIFIYIFICNMMYFIPLQMTFMLNKFFSVHHIHQSSVFNSFYVHKWVSWGNSKGGRHKCANLVYTEFLSRIPHILLMANCIFINLKLWRKVYSVCKNLLKLYHFKHLFE